MFNRRLFAPLQLFLVLASLSAVLFGAPAYAQSAGLDSFIRNKMRSAEVPGLAACIIKGDQIVWSKGYGKSNISLGTAVTPDTSFLVASVSKTITGTALMRLHEQGFFDLDADVNTALNFAVNSPSHPNNPITYRSLLSHTSGIKDNWTVLDANYVLGDSPIALGYFLEQYLTPGGSNYNSNRNFYSWRPETRFGYSNMGAALAGHMVEALTGVPFDKFCQKEIFRKLHLDNTSWKLSNLDVNNVAMPYSYKVSNNTFTPYGHYGFPDYPNGGLRTSVNDLSRFLIAHMNRGVYHGHRILDSETVALMKQIQYPSVDNLQGLAFYYWWANGKKRYGHSGGDWGVVSEMWYIPSEDVGVIILTNGDAKQNPIDDILDRLFLEANGL